jgi:hypothetical protein
MNVSASSKAVVAMLVVAGTLGACTSVKKDAPEQPASQQPVSQQTVAQPTYRPTGSHIVERADGRRSPKNSSGAPVQDLKNAPAVTVIQNQPPK